jgi:hypothetical protein
MVTGSYGSNDVAVSPTPTTVWAGSAGYAVAIGAPGSQLCMVTTGATQLVVQSVASYVVQAFE